MKTQDDYVWDTYTQIYKRQCEDGDVNFIIKDYVDSNDNFIINDNIGDSAKELYYQIMSKGVTSCFDCGCGPGYHLHNLNIINKTLKLAGGELLRTQINYGKEIGVNEEITNKIIELNLSDPTAYENVKDKYEFVYSVAVITHLEHSKAINVVKNMSNISSKYIFLRENMRCHDWNDILNKSGVLEKFKLIKNEEYKFTNDCLMLEKI